MRFSVGDITANYGSDYARTSTDVLLSPGERNKRLPIEINDDSIPELSETFKSMQMMLNLIIIELL